MGSVVISGATSGAVTLAVPDEAGTRTLTLPATTGTILTNDISQAGDTSAGNAAAVGYTSAEGLILTGQGSTSDVTIKNDADATVISIPTGTTQVGIGTTTPSAELGFPIGNDVEISQVAVTAHQAGNAGHIGLTIADGGGHAGFFVNNTHDGTYSDTHLSFKTGEGGVSVATERMRITPNGKVGIGTTTPASYTSDTLVISSGDQGGMTLVSANNVENYISWADGTSGGAQLQAGYIGYNHASDYMRFGTVATERMRIRSNGQVLINQTSIIGSDNAYLQVTGGSVTPVALRGGTNNYFMAFYKQSNNDLIGSITGSSGTATAFNTSSDYRLKENVSYTFDATTRLKQLKPARFNFISDDTNTLVDGFLAHEVSSIVPEAITGEKDAVDENGDAVYQGIDQSKLVPLLVKTIQEQQTVIEALETRITALEAG